MTITARRLSKLIARYCKRPKNSAGGSLHIVIDDGNYERQHIQYCIEFAETHKDYSGARLGRLLFIASRAQRIKAIKLSKEIRQ